ncbi:sulfite exporter TauE/SafE family protein [Jongsikchunia kroppenstedtii]|uniref:sulfite exporter TauE/SafE family protein n=1 Tax=Jongsikchunia kroppenstedtii TaxID=1121721 RepID=UPI00037447B5|nr:sulfite exporter TauE/SafE family protein [Jongsikchunia kroppenstedtii]
MGGWEYPYLVVAGYFAGLIGYITGLASIVSYPALLAIGLPPVAANVTNTVALVGVGAGSMTNSATELRHHPRRNLVRDAVISVVGGVLGAILLLVSSAGSFQAVVPYLIAVASLAVVAQPSLRRLAGDRTFPIAYPAGLLAVSVYGGYFGAGAGVMLLALVLVSTSESFWRAGILKSFLLGLSNLVAAIGFAFFGPVHWLPALVMAVGAFLGGWCGPPVVRHSNERLLRYLVAVCGLGLAIWLAGAS